VYLNSLIKTSFIYFNAGRFALLFLIPKGFMLVIQGLRLIPSNNERESALVDTLGDNEKNTVAQTDGNRGNPKHPSAF